MKDMSNDRRRHLRGAAREVDESCAFSNFHEDFAKANDADAAQKRAATDERKEKAEKQLADLQAFEPVLCLEGKTIQGDRVERMKKQLRWHRIIGGDKAIPPGFNSFTKQKLWETMGEAIERHQAKNVGQNRKRAASLPPSKF